jgi:hypothetical protein
MMFIIRTSAEAPNGDGFTVRLTRLTPALVATSDTRDFFCDGDPEAARQRQFNVVTLHDGWYADDSGGGVAVWGQGRFWEIRDTPFTVRETSAEAAARPTDSAADGEIVNVRQAIFGV